MKFLKRFFSVGSKNKIRYCPKCKSVKVTVNITPSAAIGSPQKWRCEDCGFESFEFPKRNIEKGGEDEKEENKN